MDSGDYDGSNGILRTAVAQSEIFESASPRANHTDSQQVSQNTELEIILERLPYLADEDLEEISAAATAKLCLRKQQDNLKAFADSFPDNIDPSFQQLSNRLLDSFLTAVSGMQVTISEQALDSTSSTEGIITISLPGLPDGVNVTRSRDTFFVNDGNTLVERNEVRVKLGGLDVYSGYWLAADSPAANVEDPLQEEGIDTLRRIMDAAGIVMSGDIYEDALEYPFLSAVLAPFGPQAIQPFEGHLRGLHAECTRKHGGRWFKMSSSKIRSTLGPVIETETSLENADGEADADSLPRSRLTAAEEAELELSKLDL